MKIGRCMLYCCFASVRHKRRLFYISQYTHTHLHLTCAKVTWYHRIWNATAAWKSNRSLFTVNLCCNKSEQQHELWRSLLTSSWSIPKRANKKFHVVLILIQLCHHSVLCEAVCLSLKERIWKAQLSFLYAQMTICKTMKFICIMRVTLSQKTLLLVDFFHCRSSHMLFGWNTHGAHVFFDWKVPLGRDVSCATTKYARKSRVLQCEMILFEVCTVFALQIVFLFFAADGGFWRKRSIKVLQSDKKLPCENCDFHAFYRVQLKCEKQFRMSWKFLAICCRSKAQTLLASVPNNAWGSYFVSANNSRSNWLSLALSLSLSPPLSLSLSLPFSFSLSYQISFIESFFNKMFVNSEHDSTCYRDFTKWQFYALNNEHKWETRSMGH